MDTVKRKKLIQKLKDSLAPLTAHEAMVLEIAVSQMEWVGFISERHGQVLERAYEDMIMGMKAEKSVTDLQTYVKENYAS